MRGLRKIVLVFGALFEPILEREPSRLDIYQDSKQKRLQEEWKGLYLVDRGRVLEREILVTQKPIDDVDLVGREALELETPVENGRQREERVDEQRVVFVVVRIGEHGAGKWLEHRLVFVALRGAHHHVHLEVESQYARFTLLHKYALEFVLYEATSILEHHCWTNR